MNFIFIFLLIGLSGAVVEILARKNFLSMKTSRTVFFFLLSSFLALTFLTFSELTVRLLLACILIIFALFFLKENVTFFSVIKKNANEFLFFTLTYLFEVLLFNTQTYPAVISFIVFSILLLVSGLTKPASGKYLQITSDKKSYVSLGVVFSVTFLALILFWQTGAARWFDFTGSLDFVYILSASTLTAFLVSVFYAMSSKGSDFLTVPLALSVLIFILMGKQDYNLLFNFSIGLFLAFVVAYLSYKVEFLTLSGAAATFLLAGFIFGLGGWKWSVPILAFFILSSILSKVRKKKNTDVDFYFEKTGVRDHWQVIANGGLGGVLILLNQMNPTPVYYYAYLASLAAVCADTWATEIGTMFPAKTISIITFKEIEQGISGGISVRGTLGATAGAFVIALSGMFWTDASLSYFLFITSAGLFGSVFDSILGATVQMQNKCVVCGKITERESHCGAVTEYHRGLKWLNNDLVNLAAGLFGIFIIITVYSF